MKQSASFSFTVLVGGGGGREQIFVYKYLMLNGNLQYNIALKGVSICSQVVPY